MEVWSGSPHSLRAYAVLTVLWPLATAVATGHFVYLPFVALNAVIAYFLMRGVRWLWWVMTVSIGLSALSLIASEPRSEAGWLGLAGEVISFALLVLPQTRRHVFGRESKAVPA